MASAARIAADRLNAQEPRSAAPSTASGRIPREIAYWDSRPNLGNYHFN